MVNFGPLAAEICWRVWGTPANFNGFRVLAALLHGTLAVGVGQTLRRWTEGATYIRQGGHHAGHWPTFLVIIILTNSNVNCLFFEPPCIHMYVVCTQRVNAADRWTVYNDWHATRKTTVQRYRPVFHRLYDRRRLLSGRSDVSSDESTRLSSQVSRSETLCRFEWNSLLMLIANCPILRT